MPELQAQKNRNAYGCGWPLLGGCHASNLQVIGLAGAGQGGGDLQPLEAGPDSGLAAVPGVS